MKKLIYLARHSGTDIKVTHFVNTDGSKGIEIEVGTKLVARVYNPSEVTGWFKNSSVANLPGWQKAFHASGLGADDFVRPNLASKHTAADYMKLVPAPAAQSVRGRITPAKEATMLRVLGRPGELTEDCSGITNHKLLARMETRQITPILKVYGFDLFLDILEKVFDELAEAEPNLYSIVTTAGCVCCREVRGRDGHFSNHSWGTAIDLKIGGILAPLAASKIPYGLIVLYAIFRKYDIFWAQGYNGRTDAMHFEAAQELILAWYAKGLLNDL